MYPYTVEWVVTALARAPEILCKNKPQPRRPASTTTQDSESLPDSSSEFDELIKSMESLSRGKILLPPDFDPLQLLNRIEKNADTRPVPQVTVLPGIQLFAVCHE